MRAAALTMCAVVAGGVFLTMYLSIWSSRQAGSLYSMRRRRLVSELVWATIPLLMVLAAAIPATLAVLEYAPVR
jgi:heme/copper-type cytochrome/quinol oxidase subunit 2